MQKREDVSEPPLLNFCQNLKNHIMFLSTKDNEKRLLSLLENMIYVTEAQLKKIYCPRCHKSYSIQHLIFKMSKNQPLSLDCHYHKLEYSKKDNRNFGNNKCNFGKWLCCGHPSIWSMGCHNDFHIINQKINHVSETTSEIETAESSLSTKDLEEQMYYFRKGEGHGDRESYLYLSFGNFLGLLLYHFVKNIKIKTNYESNSRKNTKILNQLLNENIGGDSNYYISTDYGTFSKPLNVVEDEKYLKDFSIQFLLQVLDQMCHSHMLQTQYLIKNSILLIEPYIKCKEITPIILSIDLLQGEHNKWKLHQKAYLNTTVSLNVLKNTEVISLTMLNYQKYLNETLRITGDDCGDPLTLTSTQNILDNEKSASSYSDNKNKDNTQAFRKYYRRRDEKEQKFKEESSVDLNSILETLCTIVKIKI